MKQEIEVQKGEETNKLLVIRELSQDLNNMFETVKRKNASDTQKMFCCDNMTVSKRRFKATLTIEILD